MLACFKRCRCGSHLKSVGLGKPKERESKGGRDEFARGNRGEGDGGWSRARRLVEARGRGGAEVGIGCC